jgi:hypothetical protein
MADEPSFRLVYDEAVRALRAQADAHNALRTRAGTVLATSLVVTSFFGGQAVARNAAPSSLGWLAVVAFLAAGVLSVGVLFPTDLRFTTSVEEVVSLVETSGDAYRELALRLAHRFETNQRQIAILQQVFRAAAVALLLEATLWIAYLSQT